MNPPAKRSTDAEASLNERGFRRGVAVPLSFDGAISFLSLIRVAASPESPDA